MTSYFEEKSQQVEPASMKAFGVNISSGHGKATEIIEMITFCRLVATDEIVGVKSLFYDSNSDCCQIECGSQVAKDLALAAKVELAAKRSLSQYELLGKIGHGLVVAR
jgi:hypothetical protein